MKYLDKLNLDSELTFGTEIEFNGPRAIEFSNANKDLPMELIHYHYKQKLDFDKWYVDMDTSLFRYNEEPNGGELSSKIMHNEGSDWEELKLFCERLKSSGAYITNRCSNHISIGTESFQYNKEFFLLLEKVIMTFEREICFFSYGDFLTQRNFFDKYSKLLQNPLIYKIREGKYIPLLEEDYKIFMGKYCIDRFEDKIFRKHDAIHFDFYHDIFVTDDSHSRANKYNRIEFRYPNGSINPVIIQNNINFFLKIVLAILHNRFDQEYLDSVIKRYVIDDYYYVYQAFSVENMNKLMEAICLDSDDKNNFGEQFERVRTIKGIKYIL